MAKIKNGLFAEERKIKIQNLVKEHKKVTVSELCKLYNVSSATIRNDLRDLQSKGVVTRTHGGAIEKAQTGFELEPTQKKSRNIIEKQKIAETALELVEDGDKIILDTGTTILEMAKLLYQKNHITILTNDIDVARVLEDHETAQVIVMGGILRKKFHCTTDIHGTEIYNSLIADKAFMGVNALSLVNGAMTPDINQAQTKKLMISISKKMILLCDSSKLGKASFVQFSTVEEIDTVVTDYMDKTAISKFEDNGVEVIIAK